jgi:hypothetical protein
MHYNEDISAGLPAVTIPVMVAIGDRDQVEHETELDGEGSAKGPVRFSPDSDQRADVAALLKSPTRGNATG